MDEARVQNTPEQPKSKKSKNMTIKVNRTLFYIGAAVLSLVIVFFLGKSYGAKQQKEAKTNSPLSSRSAAAVSSRWTTIGNITDVSNSKIKVKDSRGEEKEAAINDQTKITNRKGETLKASDLKKDNKVIVSGTKDEKDDKKLTATRIRLQQ